MGGGAWGPCSLSAQGIMDLVPKAYIVRGPVEVLQECLAHEKTLTPWHHHRALGICLLKGPMGGAFWLLALVCNPRWVGGSMRVVLAPRWGYYCVGPLALKCTPYRL